MHAAQAETIFVVDDDEGMRVAIERLVKLAGYDCAAFASAEALLSQPAPVPAACVVSDLKLPGISGLDLLDILHAREGAAPLILITAHDAPGLRDEAMRRGAAGYLPKPFRGTTLLETIRSVVQR